MHDPQQCLPLKHLQHPFLYISPQVKKKEGKDEGTGRPDPVNSRAAQQQEKATALPADKKTITRYFSWSFSLRPVAIERDKN